MNEGSTPEYFERDLSDQMCVWVKLKEGTEWILKPKDTGGHTVYEIGCCENSLTPECLWDMGLKH